LKSDGLKKTKLFQNSLRYLQDWKAWLCKTGGVMRERVLGRRWFCRKCDFWSIC